MSPLLGRGRRADDERLILEHRPSARRRLKNAARHARKAQTELERAMREVDGNETRDEMQALARVAESVGKHTNHIAETRL